MTITWKKWGLFFLSTVLLFAICHRYAKRNLVPIDIHDVSESIELFDHIRIPIRIPWPAGAWTPKLLPDFTSPIPPTDCDAETLMGIPLLDSVPLEWLESNDGVNQLWNWSQKWFELALAQARDPETKTRLQQFLLAGLTIHFWSYPNQSNVDIWWKLKHLFPEIPSDKASNRDARVEILRLAPLIDPQNALYDYCRVWFETEKILARPECKNTSTRPTRARSTPRTNPAPPTFTYSYLPHVRLTDILFLQAPDSLIPEAKRINNLLGKAETRKRLRGFAADRSDFIEKAAIYCWGPDVGSKMILSNCSTSLFDNDGGFFLRHLADRLCFIADELAARHQDDLALSFYRHTQTLANRLAFPEDQIFSSHANAIGREISRLVTRHLLAYWASRANPEKVMAAHEQYFRLRNPQNFPPSDPLESHTYGLNHGSPYARMAVLAWWLALTAIFMFLLSLILAVVHAVLRREKFTAPPLHIPGKIMILGLVLPLLVMLFSAAFFPFNVRPCCGGTRLFEWIFLSIILQMIILIYLSGPTQNTPSSNRPFIRKFLTWLVPGIFLFCFAGDFFTDGSDDVSFLPFAWLLLGFWLAFLVFKNLYLWISPCDTAAKTLGARMGKTAAVFSILLANVMLLTTLPALALTYGLQKDYYQAINDRNKIHKIDIPPALTSLPSSTPITPFFPPPPMGFGGLGDPGGPNGFFDPAFIIDPAIDIFQK